MLENHHRLVVIAIIFVIFILGWWRGVAVTRCVRSAKLLYTGPG